MHSFVCVGNRSSQWLRVGTVLGGFFVLRALICHGGEREIEKLSFLCVNFPIGHGCSFLSIWLICLSAQPNPIFFLSSLSAGINEFEWDAKTLIVTFPLSPFFTLELGIQDSYGRILAAKGIFLFCAKAGMIFVFFFFFFFLLHFSDLV